MKCLKYNIFLVLLLIDSEIRPTILTVQDVRTIKRLKERSNNIPKDGLKILSFLIAILISMLCPSLKRQPFTKRYMN